VYCLRLDFERSGLTLPATNPIEVKEIQ